MTLDKQVVVNLIGRTAADRDATAQAIADVAVDLDSRGRIVQMYEARSAAAAFARVLHVMDEVVANHTSAACPVPTGIEHAPFARLVVGSEKAIELHQVVVAREPDADVACVVDQVVGDADAHTVEGNGLGSCPNDPVGVVDVAVVDEGIAADQLVAVTGLEQDAYVARVVDIAAHDLVPIAGSGNAGEGHIANLARRDTAIRTALDADAVASGAFDSQPAKLDVVRVLAVNDGPRVDREGDMIVVETCWWNEVEHAFLAIQIPLARRVQFFQ